MASAPEFEECLVVIHAKLGVDVDVISNHVVGENRKIAVKDKKRTTEFSLYFNAKGEIIPSIERSFFIHSQPGA